MSRIGNGGRPPGSGEPPKAGEAGGPQKANEAQGKEGTQKFREVAEQKNVPQKVVDSFEKAAPQLARQLQNIGKNGLQFSSAQLAQLAAAFASVLQKNPGAERRERAKMFSQAVLTNKEFGKLFADANEADLEKMFDTIAEQLDGSPRFAQLVDEVTEGARKMSL